MPTSRTDRARADAGLTLLEMLVVIAVIALIAISLPSLLTRPAGHGNTVREVVASLRAARAQAVFAGTPMDMEIDLDQRLFGHGAAKTALPVETELTLTTAREIQTATGRPAIRFFPDGSASGGRVTVTSGTQRDVVLVSWLTGRITVAK